MRILLCTWTLPYPTDIGGRQRTNLLYNALAELGDVDCLVLDGLNGLGCSDLSILRERYNVIANAPMTHASGRGLWQCLPVRKGAFFNRLAHNIDASRSLYSADARLLQELEGKVCFDDYDVIVGRYAKSLSKLGLPNGRVPVLLDIDDLDSDVYASRLNEPGKGVFERFILKQHLRNIQKRLPKLLKRIDHCMVANVNNLDGEGVGSVSVLPNIPFNLPKMPEPMLIASEYARTMMVIGSYNHPPNRQGVQWFLDHVWPKVLRSVPDAKFRIYGSAMTDDLKANWGARHGVEAIGFVESVEAAYRDCALTVCPVNYGAGTNIKVLESFAYGRQCVLTRAAARGFETEPCFEGLLAIADASEAMASQIVTVLNNPDRTLEVAGRLQRVVEKYYSRSSFNEAVSVGVQSAIENFRTRTVSG